MRFSERHKRFVRALSDAAGMDMGEWCRVELERIIEHKVHEARLLAAIADASPTCGSERESGGTP